MNIRGKQIKDLITKFYYKNNDLYFQILLMLTDRAQTVTISEHSDYAEYKAAYNQLIQIKTNNLSLVLPKTNQNISESVLS